MKSKLSARRRHLLFSRVSNEIQGILNRIVRMRDISLLCWNRLVNMRFRAKNTWDSAQGYIQCMKCIGSPVVRTDGRTDVRTYGCTDVRTYGRTVT